MLCCDSGFQNCAHCRLCSNPVFADASSRVYWVVGDLEQFRQFLHFVDDHLPDFRSGRDQLPQTLGSRRQRTHGLRLKQIYP